MVTAYIVVFASTDDGAEDTFGPTCRIVSDLPTVSGILTEFSGSVYYSFELTGPL